MPSAGDQRAFTPYSPPPASPRCPPDRRVEVVPALQVGLHQEQLRALLQQGVREGFAQLDSGEIDEFDVDDLIQRSKRAAVDLWKFCV